jgi:hypothetical protein
MSRQFSSQLTSHLIRIDIQRRLDVTDQLTSSGFEWFRQDDCPSDSVDLRKDGSGFGRADKFSCDLDQVVTSTGVPQETVGINPDNITTSPLRITVISSPESGVIEVHIIEIASNNPLPDNYFEISVLEFVPSCKMNMVANDLPEIEGTTSHFLGGRDNPSSDSTNRLRCSV